MTPAILHNLNVQKHVAIFSKHFQTSFCSATFWNGRLQYLWFTFIRNMYISKMVPTYWLYHIVSNHLYIYNISADIMDSTCVDMDNTMPSTIHLQTMPFQRFSRLRWSHNNTPQPPGVQASRSKDTWEMPRAPAVRRTDVPTAWRCLNGDFVGNLPMGTCTHLVWSVNHQGGMLNPHESRWFLPGMKKMLLIQLGNKLLQKLGMNITKIETTSCQLVIFFVMYTSFQQQSPPGWLHLGLAIQSWIFTFHCCRWYIPRDPQTACLYRTFIILISLVPKDPWYS